MMTPDSRMASADGRASSGAVTSVRTADRLTMTEVVAVGAEQPAGDGPERVAVAYVVYREACFGELFYAEFAPR